MEYSSNSSSVNLLKAAKEFNIGLSTLVETLGKMGFKVDPKPNTKISAEMYSLLRKEYISDKIVREEARQIIIGKIRREDSIPKDYELVKTLIEDCIREKKTVLDLGKCGLTSGDFKKGAPIDKLLRKCTQVEKLILSNEWWVDESESRTRRKEKSSNIGQRNSLSEIPGAVQSLKNLSVLICCGEDNESWEIKNTNVISNAESVRCLDLRNNNIKTIAPLLSLRQLNSLYLGNNEITEVEGIRKLNNLEKLDISSNSLTDITPISKLTKLRFLDCSNNKIAKVSLLGSIESLEELYLTENNIGDIDELKFVLKREAKIYLEISDNPFVAVKQLNLFRDEDHFNFVKEVLTRNIYSSSKVSVTYPAKILLLGNHASGKSTLVNYLTGSHEVGSTHLLRIENYFIDNTQSGENLLPNAIFFDFGGQDFYHGVYQIFISKDSLQIILFNEKNNKNSIIKDCDGRPTINFDLNYWLEQKAYHEANTSDRAHFILCQSFSNIGSSYSFDFQPIKHDGYLRSFFLCLASEEDDVYKKALAFYEAEKAYFKAYLDSHLKKSQITSMEPKWYVDFLKYIFDKNGKDERPTKLHDILIRYKSPEPNDEQKLQSLRTTLITLHRHGIVLFYDDIKGLEDVVWLNPAELVRFIQDKILGKKGNDFPSGIVSRKIFETQINDDKLLLLLRTQKVIFLHQPSKNNNDDEYIIPNYLPIATPDNLDLQLFLFDFGNANLTLKFKDFIPFGFINQMICFFGMQPDIKKFWRNKLLFTLNGQVRVLIEIDFEMLLISVRFQQKDKLHFSEEILKEYLFYSILGLYWNIDTTEIFNLEELSIYANEPQKEKDHSNKQKNFRWNLLKTKMEYVPSDLFLSVDSKNYVRYFDLFEKSEDHKLIQAFEIDRDGRINLERNKDVDLIQFKPFSDKNFIKMKQVFIAYSKYDEAYLQELEDHLVTLKQEGLATFNCGKIELGKEWDSEIKRQLDLCDIMVCLVSVKFLNTDYVTKIEIPNAIAQEKLIIPIIIKACDWENSQIGKYQAAKRGRIVSLDNEKLLYNGIRAQSSEERDAFWTEIVKEFRKKVFEEN